MASTVAWADMAMGGRFRSVVERPEKGKPCVGSDAKVRNEGGCRVR